jgi:hypothetical protein
MEGVVTPRPGDIASGIVHGGRVIGGTEWVLRDPSAWWDLTSSDVRPRNGHRPRLIVGHWGGGRHHVGPGAARKMVANMNARRREDGSDMSVSCGFVISWDGLCWQTADLDTATIHVGSRPVISRSIGVEIAWCGYESQARRLGIDGVHILPRVVDGQRLRVVRPSDAIVETWARLCDTLATVCGIPRVLPPTSTALLSAAELAQQEGAIEHMTLGGPQKRDAAGLLIEALAARGWASARRAA